MSNPRKIYEEWNEIKKARSMLWWKEAKRIWELKNGNWREVFGSGLETTWKSFVAECGEVLTTVDYKAKVWQKFIVDLKQKEEDLYGINPAKLRLLAETATNKNVEKIIGLARELSFGDLKQEIKEHVRK